MLLVRCQRTHPGSLSAEAAVTAARGMLLTESEGMQRFKQPAQHIADGTPGRRT
jgi:hypothetical protein